jgi:hypothetical protein
MPTDVSEPIRVAAIFTRGEVHPVWFDRNGLQIRVREIAFSWTTREGNAGILHFSVTDGHNLYEICFNTSNMNWKLNYTEVP